MADHFTLHCAAIDAGEIFFYCRGEQCLAAHRRAVDFVDCLDEADRTTAEALELDAAVASNMGGVAVASPMNLYRCDH